VTKSFLFLDQPSSKKRLAFKAAPTQFDLDNGKTVHCKCFDDGSIIWHEQDWKSERWMLGNHFCSVETKPSFISSDKDGKGKISSQMIPQYACELIGVVMQRWKKGVLDTSIDYWYVFFFFLLLYRMCYLTNLGNL